MTAPGQADEYTPTEDEVRDTYGWLSGSHRESAYAEFDRFLAARDRAVRGATLEEAAQIAEPYDGYTDWKKEFHPGVYGPKIAALIRAAANQTGEANAEN